MPEINVVSLRAALFNQLMPDKWLLTRDIFANLVNATHKKNYHLEWISEKSIKIYSNTYKHVKKYIILAKATASTAKQQRMSKNCAQHDWNHSHITCVQLKVNRDVVIL